MNTYGWNSEKLQSFELPADASNEVIDAQLDEVCHAVNARAAARFKSRRAQVADGYIGSGDSESRAVAEFMRLGKRPPYALLVAWAGKAPTDSVA